MGLGAPTKRAKISHDPNNTAWSRSSTKYGQRILESLGWAPGGYLGATDAPHANLHSAASASHIRIALKDDNLGLGAKRGANDDIGKATGLELYQDLLGRLNGKTEQEVDNEKRVRSNRIVEQTWEKLRFVSGGFLVGDNLKLSKERSSVEYMARQIVQDPEEVATHGLKTDQKGSPKQRKKRKRRRAQRVQAETNEHSLASPQPAKETFFPQKVSLEVVCAAQGADRVTGLAEKAERKLKRQDRKEAKNKSRNEKFPPSMALPLPDTTHLQSQMPVGQVPAEHTDPEASVPNKAYVAVVRGRNAVRQRYIQQKKMAMMDSKALNEIFMIKT